MRSKPDRHEDFIVDPSEVEFDITLAEIETAIRLRDPVSFMISQLKGIQAIDWKAEQDG